MLLPHFMTSSGVILIRVSRIFFIFQNSDADIERRNHDFAEVIVDYSKDGKEASKSLVFDKDVDTFDRFSLSEEEKETNDLSEYALLEEVIRHF